MNKYPILIAMISMLMAACSNEADETLEDYQPSMQAIVFEAVQDDDCLTRATGELNSLDNTAIGVFAAYTGKLTYENTTVLSDFMYNQPVTYNATVGKWEYQPLKYWPNNGTDYVSFFAYAPYEAAPASGKCITDMSKRDDPGDPWLNYRLATDPWSTTNPQVDLLYGQRRTGTSTYTSWLDQQKFATDDEPLKFTFRHALACIGDNITLCVSQELADKMSGYADITVTNIKIDYRNLTTKARLVLRSEGSANWKEIISGEITTTRTYSKSLDLTFARNATDNTTPKTVSNGEGLFYIPLIVAGAKDPYAEVTLSYTVTNYVGKTFTGTSVATFNLNVNMEGQKQAIALKLNDNIDLH